MWYGFRESGMCMCGELWTSGPDGAIGFDTDSDGAVYFIAEKIPAIGYAAYAIEEQPGAPEATLRTAAGDAIENEFFRLAVTSDGAGFCSFHRITCRAFAPIPSARSM